MCIVYCTLVGWTSVVLYGRLDVYRPQAGWTSVGLRPAGRLLYACRRQVVIALLSLIIVKIFQSIVILLSMETDCCLSTCHHVSFVFQRFLIIAAHKLFMLHCLNGKI